MMRHLRSARALVGPVAALMLLACSDSTGPAPLQGRYELSRVGQQPMPAIIGYFGAQSPLHIMYSTLELTGTQVTLSEQLERVILGPNGQADVVPLQYTVVGSISVTGNQVTLSFPYLWGHSPILELERRGSELVRRELVEVLEPDGSEAERLVETEFIYARP